MASGLANDGQKNCKKIMMEDFYEGAAENTELTELFRLMKLESKDKQGKFDEFISPDEGLLRETCKSQNVNPILSSP